MDNRKHVLLCADAFRSSASGGNVAITTAKLLISSGYKVSVLNSEGGKYDSVDNVCVYNYPIENNAIFNNGVMRDYRGSWFAILLNKIKPDIVHECSFNIGKPRYIISIAVKLGIKVVLQPWIHDYFCCKTYGYHDARVEACTKCLDEGFTSSVKMGCDSIFGLLRSYRKSRIRRIAINSKITWISTCSSTDDLLCRYGVNPNNIKRVNLVFPKDRSYKSTSFTNKDFIWYGQPIRAKGFHLLENIARQCPNVNFKLFPGSKYVPQLTDVKNVQIDTRITWSNGLVKQLCDCYAVILPTLWPTTPEYVLLEAIGHGRPVIAFNVGAHRDILMNGRDSLISEPVDIDGMCANIKSMAMDETLRNKLSEGAIETFNDYADEKKYVDSLEKSYGWK
ncbi:MAG: glycosyltransferase family 4 protein [Phycisphaerae bacterium]